MLQSNKMALSREPKVEWSISGTPLIVEGLSSFFFYSPSNKVSYRVHHVATELCHPHTSMKGCPNLNVAAVAKTWVLHDALSPHGYSSSTDMWLCSRIAILSVTFNHQPHLIMFKQPCYTSPESDAMFARATSLVARTTQRRLLPMFGAAKGTYLVEIMWCMVWDGLFFFRTVHLCCFIDVLAVFCEFWSWNPSAVVWQGKRVFLIVDTHRSMHSFMHKHRGILVPGDIRKDFVLLVPEPGWDTLLVSSNGCAV